MAAVALSSHRKRPRYWAAVWSFLEGAHLTENTLRKKVTEIDATYKSFEAQSGWDCLDDRLFSFDLDKIEKFATGFFTLQQNLTAQKQRITNNAWRFSRTFLTEILRRLASNGTEPSLAEERMARLRAFERNMSWLKVSEVRKKVQVIRALPSLAIEELYEIVDPADSRNPFRTETAKWRNFCLILAMLHQGLRRSEALLLLSLIHISEPTRPY